MAQKLRSVCDEEETVRVPERTRLTRPAAPLHCPFQSRGSSTLIIFPSPLPTLPALWTKAVDYISQAPLDSASCWVQPVGGTERTGRWKGEVGVSPPLPPSGLCSAEGHCHRWPLSHGYSSLRVPVATPSSSPLFWPKAGTSPGEAPFFFFFFNS